MQSLARFRVNAYRQRGSMAAVIRVVSFGIPNWQEKDIPPEEVSMDSSRWLMMLFWLRWRYSMGSSMVMIWALRLRLTDPHPAGPGAQDGHLPAAAAHYQRRAGGGGREFGPAGRFF
mgnify:CR=1 FL=1